MTVEDLLLKISKGINPFDSAAFIASCRLDDTYKDFVCRTTRALDKTDGLKRVNRLPPNYRAAIMRTGYNDR